MYEEDVEKIINHLMFHQCLIGEDREGVDRLDEYIKMAKEIGGGNFILPKNPVDRAIAIAFQLVIENHMDPWRIDLRKFVSLYLDRIEKDELIDFITAGKIILMAWSILQMKAEVAYEKISISTSVENNSIASQSTETLDCLELTAEGGNGESIERNYIQNLPALKLPVRRCEKKRIYLIDLIEALESARIFVKNRSNARAEGEPPKTIEGRIHAEEEKDVSRIWEKICRLDRDEFCINEIMDKATREEFIRIFMSVLFLMKSNKIIIEQEVPFGTIRIKVLVREYGDLKESQEMSEVTVSY